MFYWKINGDVKCNNNQIILMERAAKNTTIKTK